MTIDEPLLDEVDHVIHDLKNHIVRHLSARPCNLHCGSMPSPKWNGSIQRATQNIPWPQVSLISGNQSRHGGNGDSRGCILVHLQRAGQAQTVLILTRNSAIRVLNSLTVAPITTTIRDIPTEVRLHQADGLLTDCAVNLDNIQTVQKLKMGYIHCPSFIASYAGCQKSDRIRARLRITPLITLLPLVKSLKIALTF